MKNLGNSYSRHSQLEVLEVTTKFRPGTFSHDSPNEFFIIRRLFMRRRKATPRSSLQSHLERCEADACSQLELTSGVLVMLLNDAAPEPFGKRLADIVLIAICLIFASRTRRCAFLLSGYETSSCGCQMSSDLLEHVSEPTARS